MYRFTESDPALESYWRAIVLFGRNVASYKFALAKSLLDLAEQEREAVSLGELAVPFSEHLCEHLRDSEKQGTFSPGRFLDACREFNRGEIDQESLVATTAKLGFVNVIDAFHVVGGGDIAIRFFEDERRGSTRGIRLTDNLLAIAKGGDAPSLPAEAEARWRLVETAWELDLPAHALTVAYEPEAELLIPDRTRYRRRSITGVRDALNGYQKGRCFYCFDSISVVAVLPDCAEVDHFFPHILKPHRVAEPVDGVWNLVLACSRCNGAGAKWARTPALRYLERLHRRNEFLITSHHPLRDTLMLQTGSDEQARAHWLNRTYQKAKDTLGGNTWDTNEMAPATF